MKLVRDRIGDVSWVDEPAKRHLRRVEPGSPEHRDLLVKKLHEEVAELLDAFTAGPVSALAEEAADIYEVLLGILACQGVERPRSALLGAAGRKRTARGGFAEGRTYDGPVRDDHPWHAQESK